MIVKKLLKFCRKDNWNQVVVMSFGTYKLRINIKFIFKIEDIYKNKTPMIGGFVLSFYLFKIGG